MSRYIEKPLLPQTDVTLCCVSCDAKAVVAALRKRGIAVVEMPRSALLPKALASHADLQILPLGGRDVLLNEEHRQLAAQLELLGFCVQMVHGLADTYPNDCLLNCLPIDGRLLCNKKAVWQPLLERFAAIHVNQGYTRCSSLLLHERHIITDDPSIFAAAPLHGLTGDYLPQNEILLDGYDKGFLGGSCGLIGKREVAISAKGREQGLFSRLEQKLTDHGYTVTALTEGEIADIGGIIPLLQK